MNDKMERIQGIICHPLWQENFHQLQTLERSRVFCKHTIEHFMDVARIAYIEALEKGLAIPKEQIYAAALLHDIGRAAQYMDGTPHHEAGAALSARILADCGFEEQFSREIIKAIEGHRNPATAVSDDLAGLICRADKASRLCLFCPSQKDCNWSDEKKNRKITR